MQSGQFLYRIVQFASADVLNQAASREPNSYGIDSRVQQRGGDEPRAQADIVDAGTAPRLAAFRRLSQASGRNQDYLEQHVVEASGLPALYQRSRSYFARHCPGCSAVSVRLGHRVPTSRVRCWYWTKFRESPTDRKMLNVFGMRICASASGVAPLVREPKSWARHL